MFSPKLFAAGVLAASLLLSGCNAPVANEPTVAPTVASTDNAGYPAPSAEAVDPSGYPAPDATARPEGYPLPPTAEPLVNPEPIAVPTPSSNQVGVVSGVVLYINPEGNTEALPDYGLYLGRVITASDGISSMTEFNRDTSLRGRLDNQGGFIFTDVPPGFYALVYNTPQGAIGLNDPETGLTIAVNVAGGGQYDMGSYTFTLEGIFR